jgi:hypothetical protein
MTGRTVGVFPRAEWDGRRRLFDALQLVFPVRFEGRDDGDWAGLDGGVFFGTAPSSVPSFPGSWLAFESGLSDRLSGGRVSIGRDPLVDPRLSGRDLMDGEAGGARPLRPSESARVLAATAAGPVWLVSAEPGRARHYWASVAPAELAADEPLRARLQGGSFLGLLPVVELLRELAPDRPWSQPSPRACFIIDDPNLHARQYGHVDFPSLVTHAKRGGYHVAIASTPLDYGFVHPDMRVLFSEQPDQVSLAIHGNNHLRRELCSLPGEMAALALGAQALQRSERLERRTGLRVSRVMCPPHEECGQIMLGALFRLGFDAMIREPTGQISRGGENPDGVLAGWEPAQLLAGLPVLPRYRRQGDDEDLVFRAYLNLPLVFAFHHWDLAGGPGALDAVADRVNRLGQPAWMSLADLCRTNVVAWRIGNTLVVRPYARRVSLKVDPEVERIVVETPTSDPPVELRVSSGSASRRGPAGSSFVFTGPIAPEVEIEMGCPDVVPAGDVAQPPRRLWPYVRRLLTESRDRLAPVPGRIGLGRAGA